MTIITKTIKYSNNLFFIKNSKYTRLYFYFAQKTQKNTLYNTRKLLNSYQVELIHYNKQWQKSLPFHIGISNNLLNISSSLWLGLIKKTISNENALQICKLKIDPLVLINYYMPKQTPISYSSNTLVIGLIPINFFSKALINQYFMKMKIFNNSIFYWLSLIYK